MDKLRKKIILFTDAWQPQVNGVVRCVEVVRDFLEKDNFNVILVHPGDFKSYSLSIYPEIKFATFTKSKINKIIRDEKPDFVHIFTEGPIGFTARSVCLKQGVKFTTSHHTNFQYYIEHYIKISLPIIFKSVYAYLKWFHNASDNTMVITESIKRNLEKRGFLHLSLWTLGVDLELFKRNESSNIKNQYKLQSPVFVYFGRISREKNLEEYLKLDLPGTKLVIGGGPMKDKLEKKYGKTNIFLGYRKGQELVDFLSVCDVFVFPSKTDIFPLSIVEAFACGLPVAAHNVMDLNELVKEGVGFLDEDLKIASIKCLNIPRENCRNYALGYSWENSVKYFKENLVSN
ncbi:MAG: glycosyltransferase family 1 protein [Candidatus Staskawiczbacteria bacterium]|nr:glycosyltransferase family 1 protein [Candidatus Staskawiczbacteria bacterium]